MIKCHICDEEPIDIGDIGYSYYMCACQATYIVLDNNNHIIAYSIRFNDKTFICSSIKANITYLDDSYGLNRKISIPGFIDVVANIDGVDVNCIASIYDKLNKLLALC